MKNNLLKAAGAVALIVAANVSFAQVNLGVKSSTNVSAKANTGIVKKTVGATTNATNATVQKTKQVKAKTTNTVRESARVNGSVNANANANANAQNNANANSVLNGSVSSEAAIDTDGRPVIDRTKEVKEKTRESADKAKTKIKDKAEDTKVKVKEAKPSVDGSVNGEAKVKAKKNS